MRIEIDYDPKKNETNIAERGLSFDLVEELDWLATTIKPDLRVDYGEDRWIATGPIRGRVCVMCYTWRARVLRVISLRKANDREIRDYEQEGATTIDGCGR